MKVNKYVRDWGYKERAGKKERRKDERKYRLITTVKRVKGREDGNQRIFESCMTDTHTCVTWAGWTWGTLRRTWRLLWAWCPLSPYFSPLWRPGPGPGGTCTPRRKVERQVKSSLKIWLFSLYVPASSFCWYHSKFSYWLLISWLPHKFRKLLGPLFLMNFPLPNCTYWIFSYCLHFAKFVCLLWH